MIKHVPRIVVINAEYAHALDLKQVEVEIGAYPDNMPLIKKNFKYGFDKILLRPLTLSDFMAAMFLVDAFCERKQNKNKITLALPNIPGARQDRLGDGDYLFTAKSIAKEINARNFKAVVVLDPHSEVAPALINNCMSIRSYSLPDIVLPLRARRYDAVIAPDAGAEKRAGGMAKALGIPLINAWKTRDVATGNISGFGCSPLGEAKKVLIVDDICDGGGTFLGLKGILPADVKCDIFVTHGIFSKGTKSLLSAFDTVFCTDSTVQCQQDGVNVIDVCETLSSFA